MKREESTKEHLFDQLKKAVEIQEAKTHETLLAGEGDDIDFARARIGADISTPIQDDTHLSILDDCCILFNKVGDCYALFNKEDLTEDLVNEIKSKLGI